jgi:tetratricopeptide (TPR) repeat protein
MSDDANDTKDTKDTAYWEAVEEATELLHEERWHEALTKLRDVLKNDPTNPYAYHYAGVALYESGELEAARDAYRASLKLAPKFLGARIALAHVLRELGDTRDAAREGLEALSQAPGDGDALYAVGLAYFARGEYAPARKYLEAFLASRPEFEVATEVQALLARIAELS